MNEILSPEVEKQSMEIVSVAKSLEVKNNEQYIKASDFLVVIKGLQGEVNKSYNPVIEAAHDTHKKALAAKAEKMNPLLDAERLVKTKRGGWEDIMEAKRREEERLAQAKAAEKERKEKEELERQAKLAEKKGQTEKAEALREQKEDVFVPVPVIATKLPETKGVSSYQKWIGEIKNPDLFFEKANRLKIASFCEIVEGKVNSFAKTDEGRTEVPGIVWKQIRITSGSFRK